MSSINDKISSSSPMKPADYNLDETKVDKLRLTNPLFYSGLPAEAEAIT